VFEPSQPWSPKLQRRLNLIIRQTLDLLSQRYSVRLPWESPCKHSNYRPQHDQVWSARVSSSGRYCPLSFQRRYFRNNRGRARNNCYRDKANKLPMRVKRLHLAHHCSLHGGNPSDSLSKSLIATIDQMNVELSCSSGLREYIKFGS